MRKIFAVVIAAATLLSLLGGCAKEPIEKAQAKVVEIGEQYLNFEITAAEAVEKLEAIKVPEAEGRGQDALETFRDGLVRRIEDPDTPYEEIKKEVDLIAKIDFVDF
jgi:hypothetical protein